MIDDNEEVQQQEPGAPEPEAPAAPPPQPSLFDNDKPPPGPVDVDLSDGGEVAPVEAEPEPQQEPVPERKPRQRSGNRQTAQERLNQVTYERREIERVLEAERAERAAERAQLEQRNRELAERSQHVDAVGFDAHEARWSTAAAAAKEALKAALATQDPDQIANATDRMTEARAELQAVNAYKAQFPDQFDESGKRKAIPQQRQQQPVYQPQQQPAPAPAAAPPPELQQWVADNQWIDGRSPDHDPEMARAATRISSYLDARYNDAGRSEEIGRGTYLQELNGMLQQEFPDAYGDQPAPPPTRRPTMTRPNGAGVAPASRTAPTSQSGQPGSNSVRMSAEEHDFALKMTRNGAYRYEPGHPKQGQRMNDADGVRYHAKYVQRDRDMDPMRGKR